MDGLVAAVKDPIGAASSALLSTVSATAGWRLGFSHHAVDLLVPAAAGDTQGRSVTMRYLERGPTDAPFPLVMIPGFTAEVTAYYTTVKKLGLPPTARVIIIEIPGQGGSRLAPTPPWTDFLSESEMVAAMGVLIQRLGVTPARRADILGFSLGGGLAVGLCKDHGELFRKRVLVAPGIRQCIDAQWLELASTRPKEVHCFETFEELKGAYAGHAIDFHPHRLPPDFLLRGMAFQRRLYGEGYFIAMMVALWGEALTVADDEDRGGDSMDDVRAVLSSAAADTVIIIGDRDRCINPAAVADLAAAAGVRCVLLKDVGHVGGPADRPWPETMFSLMAPPAAAHLLGASSAKL